MAVYNIRIDERTKIGKAFKKQLEKYAEEQEMEWLKKEMDKALKDKGKSIRYSLKKFKEEFLNDF